MSIVKYNSFCITSGKSHFVIIVMITNATNISTILISKINTTYVGVSSTHPKKMSVRKVTYGKCCFRISICDACHFRRMCS